MSKVQFIKLGEHYGIYWIFDKEYKETPDHSWYDLHFTEKKIKAEDLIFMGTRSFEKLSNLGPVWGPAIDYAEEITANFIHQAKHKQIHSSQWCHPINLTVAVFFRRRKDSKKIGNPIKSMERVKSRFELIDLRK